MNIEPGVVEIANQIALNVVKIKSEIYKNYDSDYLAKQLVKDYYQAYTNAIKEIYELQNQQNEDKKLHK